MVALTHFDIVGSFLRPAKLKQTRKDFETGKIDEQALKLSEDQTIEELVAKQKQLGLKAVSDGEFRRGFWHLDFLENLTGVEGYVPAKYNQQFQGTDAPAYNVKVVDKVAFNFDHPFLKDFSFLKQVAGKDVLAKLTIPAPTMLYRQEILANDGRSQIREIYPNLADFYHDLAKTYSDAIQAFYALGCRYLQFDDTNWAFLADEKKRQELLIKGIDPTEASQISRQIINEALVNKPIDLTITTHICRGNHASAWLFSGGYEAVADDLFATNYDGYFLEFDDERSGDFSPLAKVSDDKRVVLGLVTSKRPKLEPKATLIKRIKDASNYHPLENLALSTQCGFASTQTGNKLTQDDQWAKLKLVIDTANEVWH